MRSATAAKIANTMNTTKPRGRLTLVIDFDMPDGGVFETDREENLSALDFAKQVKEAITYELSVLDHTPNVNISGKIETAQILIPSIVAEF